MLAEQPTHLDGMQLAVQPHPKALYDLPCTLTYPVVAEVPGKDGRSEGAGRVHPRTSVIHLQKTQLQLRHPTQPFQLLFFTAANGAIPASHVSRVESSTGIPSRDRLMDPEEQLYS